MRTTKVHQHTKKWQIILWGRVLPKLIILWLDGDVSFLFNKNMFICLAYDA
jgi:hypothetical protein